jgi:prepilin-type N-terminal cleavage/methylation domain-containing protein
MRGFTFIEMLVVVALVGVLSIAIGDSTLSFFKANYSSSGQSNSVTAAQGALDAIVRDLRQADYGADGSYPIISITPNSMKFFSGTNSNGLSRRITIQLSGTSLMEIITDPSGTPPTYSGVAAGRNMADNVQNVPLGKPLFRYFDSSGNEITDFSQITSVASVAVTVSVNADPKRLREFTLQSSATLRNLRKN